MTDQGPWSGGRSLQAEGESAVYWIQQEDVLIQPAAIHEEKCD